MMMVFTRGSSRAWTTAVGYAIVNDQTPAWLSRAVLSRDVSVDIVSRAVGTPKTACRSVPTVSIVQKRPGTVTGARLADDNTQHLDMESGFASGKLSSGCFVPLFHSAKPDAINSKTSL